MRTTPTSVAPVRGAVNAVAASRTWRQLGLHLHRGYPAEHHPGPSVRRTESSRAIGQRVTTAVTSFSVQRGAHGAPTESRGAMASVYRPSGCVGRPACRLRRRCTLRPTIVCPEPSVRFGLPPCLAGCWTRPSIFRSSERGGEAPRRRSLAHRRCTALHRGARGVAYLLSVVSRASRSIRSTTPVAGARETRLDGPHRPAARSTPPTQRPRLAMDATIRQGLDDDYTVTTPNRREERP